MKRLAVTKNFVAGIVALVFAALAVVATATADLQSMLAKAIVDLDVQGVREALKMGADPNAFHSTLSTRDGSLSGFSGSPIQWTTQVLKTELYERHKSKQQIEEKVTEILDALLQEGARVDDHILSWPITVGSKVVTKFLLDRGANPNGKSGEKHPPIQQAIEDGDTEIEALLILYGAKPLDQAADSQARLVGAAVRCDMPTMRAQLAKGAKLYSYHKFVTFQVVVEMCDEPEAVKLLLAAGADPNEPGAGQKSSLHRAVSSEGWRRNSEAAREILRILLESGAEVSVSSKDSLGRTPLHLAAEGNNLIAAKMLLEAGAKVMPRDKDGKTPLDYAESGQMIKLLKSYGAKER